MAGRHIVISPGDDPERTSAVVILLHGGQADSRAPTRRLQLSYLRMLTFAWDLRRATRRSAQGRDVAIWRLRYRVRGWNGADRDPVPDTEWAVARARQRHPGAAIVLVGHSMGGRAALWAAGAEGVTAVCALAPWIEYGDPVAQLAGRAVLIAHGDRDRITDPGQSHLYATRAATVADSVRMVDVPGAAHSLLRESARWHGLVRDFVLGVLNAPVRPLRDEPQIT